MLNSTKRFSPSFMHPTNQTSKDRFNSGKSSETVNFSKVFRWAKAHWPPAREKSEWNVSRKTNEWLGQWDTQNKDGWEISSGPNRPEGMFSWIKWLLVKDKWRMEYFGALQQDLVVFLCLPGYIWLTTQLPITVLVPFYFYTEKWTKINKKSV